MMIVLVKRPCLFPFKLSLVLSQFCLILTSVADPFYFAMDPRKYQLFFLFFFLLEIYFSNKWSVLLLWGKYLCPYIILMFLKKNVWYSYDFGWFCGMFWLFWLIFCYLDPFHETDTDPADQNETDPQHWIINNFILQATRLDAWLVSSHYQENTKLC